MVPCEEHAWKAILPRGRGDRGRRHRAQFRLSARHVGARHGRRGRPGAGIHRDGGALVQGQHPHACHHQADAQHHRHPQAGARRARRRHRRRVADQHDQLDHRGQSRQLLAGTVDRRQGHAWRLLRPGGEADRAQHGGRDRPRSGNARPADLGDRRHHHLARRGRVHGARRRQRAGLHGGDDLRLQDRAGDDRRPRELDGREGPPLARRHRRPRRRPTSPTGSISTSTMSPRRASTRTPASNAAAATSPARTPRTRRSPRWSTASGTSR